MGGDALAKLQVLLVNLKVSEDSDDTERLLAAHCSVVSVSGFDAARETLKRRLVDAAFLSFDYPQRFMLTAASQFKQDHPATPMVMMSIEHSEDLVMWAFHARMWDFVCKPASNAELDVCVEMLKAVRANKIGQKLRAPVMRPRQFTAFEPPDTRDLRLLKAIYFVERHFREDIRSRDMARLCSLSPFHFSRLFKEKFGVGFREYVVGRRLAEARRMLARSGASIGGVAYAVGFNDAAYFSRMFRRHFGQSPSTVVGVPLPTDFIDGFRLPLPAQKHV